MYIYYKRPFQLFETFSNGISAIADLQQKLFIAGIPAKIFLIACLKEVKHNSPKKLFPKMKKFLTSAVKSRE